jgi:hypothetical protein
MTDDAEGPSDIPADVAAELADLEKLSAESHRLWGRPIRWLAVAIVASVLIDVGTVLLGSGQWMLRDLAMVVGLGAMAGAALYGSEMMFRTLKERDADVIEGLRQRALVAEALEGIKPLLVAMREAHSQGKALVIPPFGPDGEPNSPYAANGEPTVH